MGIDRPVGRVLAYAAARLQPKVDSVLTAETIAIDYQCWCRDNDFAALRDGAFRAELARLAARIGLRSEANDADTLYRDVAIAACTQLPSA